MVQYAADGSLSVNLRVEEDNFADLVTIHSASIEFGIGGCYSRHAVNFPGIHHAPSRYRYAHVSSRMLTYPHVRCSRMLTYAHVCYSCMLTYADVC